MSRDWNQWESIAKGLAGLLHPLAEVSLYSEQGEEVQVLNRLSAITERPTGEVEPSTRRLPDGRVVREWVVALDQPSGYLRLRVDVSLFASLHKELGLLLGEQLPVSELSLQALVDREIQGYLREHRLSLGAASRRHRQQLVYRLHKAGAFEFKDAATHIAQALATSRATVYNDLAWATALRKVSVHQVDTFTVQRFGGNPAGVVLDALELPDEIMQRIAREMNLSETSFVLPSSVADFRLRYFTPTGHEVIFCGHSTVGALYMLAHEGRSGIVGPGTYPFTVETAAGVLAMEVTVGEEETIQVSYDTPTIALKRERASPLSIAKHLGLDPQLIDPTIPAFLENTNRTVFLTVRSLRDLEAAQLDLRRATSYGRERNLVVFCLVSNQTLEASNQLHIRCYAPTVGIAEDPFTGSVQGGLAAYALENQLVRKDITEIGIEQGDFLGRPGRVRVRIEKTGGHYRARVQASAVHCFSTEIEL